MKYTYIITLIIPAFCMAFMPFEIAVPCCMACFVVLWVCVLADVLALLHESEVSYAQEKEEKEGN